MRKKGFTFIEILIVVAILGILAAIAIPMYRTETEKARVIGRIRVLIIESEYAGEVEAGTIRIKGEPLVWDAEEDGKSYVNQIIRAPRNWWSVEEATFFIILGIRDKVSGQYSVSKEPACRKYAEILVAYWSKQSGETKSIGKCSIIVKEPPVSRPVLSRPEIDYTNYIIAEWINNIPRYGEEKEYLKETK